MRSVDATQLRPRLAWDSEHSERNSLVVIGAGGENGAVFNRSARWYDAFYANIDYEGEAEQVIGIIRSLNPQARTLLDVACGTGRHLARFRRDFECAGTDIEPTMLDIARETLPEVEFETADMIQLDLGRSFDAITCLFSSIGYTRTPDRLDQAIRAMSAHLRPGGVLVVEPWITPDGWIGNGAETVDVIDQADGKLIRIISSRRDGDETVLRMHYVRATAGEIEAEDERHQLGLFSRSRYLEAFTAAGLATEWHDPGLRGRGLLVAQAGT